MNVLARFGIVVLVAMPGLNSVAGTTQADSAKVAQQLQRYARDLRDIGKSMQAHARTTLPAELDKDQAASLAAERRALEATADAALKLAIQIDALQSKAQGRTLTGAEMESLGTASLALTDRIRHGLPGPSPPKTPTRGHLTASTREVESEQEAVRNKRQMATAAFLNFDQKARQLYSALSSVMKSFNEVRMGTVRNSL